MPEQTPSMGRVVIYFHPVERDNEGKLKVNADGSEFPRVSSPAIVQEVDAQDASKILVYVMSNYGGSVGRVSATFHAEGAPLPAANEGYWIYPPVVA